MESFVVTDSMKFGGSGLAIDFFSSSISQDKVASTPVLVDGQELIESFDSSLNRFEIPAHSIITFFLLLIFCSFFQLSW